MLRAELKRILKTRSTWCLAAIALLICLSSALSTVRQVVKYIDHDGHTEIVRGIGVYEENRQRYSVIRGEVTPELFASAVALHHELLELYGTDYDIPPEISDRGLGPYSPVYTWIFNAFSDEFGGALTSADISPERALNYYEERLATLERTLREKYEQTPQVVEYALDRLGGRKFLLQLRHRLDQRLCKLRPLRVSRDAYLRHHSRARLFRGLRERGGRHPALHKARARSACRGQSGLGAPHLLRRFRAVPGCVFGGDVSGLRL